LFCGKNPLERRGHGLTNKKQDDYRDQAWPSGVGDMATVEFLPGQKRLLAAAICAVLAPM
jgi:hypothetical protein